MVPLQASPQAGSPEGEPADRDHAMNRDELHAKAVRLERELRETRELLRRACHDPGAFTAELVSTRAYAFNAARPVAEVVSGCADSLDRYGFCVIDNVIPDGEVEAIREEVAAARDVISRNIQAIRELSGKDAPPGAPPEGAGGGVELRPVRRLGHPPKPPNDIVRMPRFARHLASPVVTALARCVLDDHLRIAQLHPRIVEAGKPDGTGVAAHRERAGVRGWHTDWPHDLSAYGMGSPLENAGCIRQPFPDVTMCLVMIWYLTDVDENSGGTWAVPGSHKDKRNPRGPGDGIMVTAPIPGDMQVRAKAGSVYIQDSRTWHASPRHNRSGRDRAAMVTRWCPWWLSVDDYAPGDAFSTSIVCRPLSQEEYLALPEALRPLMRHLCPGERDTLQQPVLDRSEAADRQNQRGFRLLEENPQALAQANAHIRVPVEDR